MIKKKEILYLAISTQFAWEILSVFIFNNSKALADKLFVMII